MIEAVRNVDAVFVRGADRITRKVINKAKKLKVIDKPGV